MSSECVGAGAYMMMERFSDVIDDCNKAIELKKDFVQVSGAL